MRSLFEENNGLSEQSLEDIELENILSFLAGLVPEAENIIWANVLN